jgi:UDP-glucuronate 4-epimerase
MPPTIEEKSKSPVYGSIEASKDQEDTNQAIERDGILCRVLVTGGAGFIGSHVVEALLLLGHEVAILDNFNDYYSPAIKRSNISEIEDRFGLDSFQLFEGDMSDPAFSQQVFESFRPTHVIHLAARAGVRASIDEPLLYVRTNLEATTLLMNLSATFGVRHFLFASSSSVYGESYLEVF